MMNATSWWKRGKVLLALAGAVLLFAGWNSATRPVAGPHSELDLLMLRNARSEEDGLYVMYSRYFATAGRCSGCHFRFCEMFGCIRRSRTPSTFAISLFASRCQP